MNDRKRNWLRSYYGVFLYRILLVLVLFALCRFLFYGLNVRLFPGIGLSDWLPILTGGLRFDVAAMLYFNCLLIFLMTVPVPYKWRTHSRYQVVVKWVFYITNGIALSLNCIDFIYYRFTLRRTTTSVFSEFSHEQNKSGLAFNFLLDYWYVVLIFIGLTVLMVFLYRRVNIKEQPAPARKTLYYIKAALIFVVTVVLAIGGIRGGFRHSTRPITVGDAGVYVKRSHEVYLVLNTPFVFIRTMGVKPLREVHYFTDKEVEQLYSPLHAPAADTVPFTKKNVVIVILESFGKEAMGFYNKDLDNGTYTGFTPFLDSLASVSKIYWNSFANGRKSIDAIPSVLSSIPSGLDPFVLTPYVSDSTKSLPQLLAREGYHTSFFHGAPNGSMGFLSYTKMIGIENYFGKTEYNNDADFDGIWGIWDEPFFQFFEQKLNNFPQPFFSSIFSVSSHHPFKVPKQYEGKFKKGPLPVMECIGYTDMALQRFFAKAQQQPWFRNTIFVITADHATISYHPEYQNAWGDIAIPILLYAPGDTAFRGIDPGVIQQLDIMPTVLGYLHYDKPYLAYGENVLNRKGAGFTYQYSGGHRWIEGNRLLFYDGKEATGLYDFKTDRLMKTDLLKDSAQAAAAMEQRLKAFIQQYNNRLIRNQLIAPR
ncbi:LTA synthase family protein [Niabella beijingensis]|uniref:LTA synthase family protein n=1 Tax=Niabella beijingensis TaxID=2872700 RepID=UPI001CBEE983|nr:alkaline phosphatase family protein [Niabella beijingensis]MBZ4188406.1 sulfatase-like hydrolase/transferase [Niabella beijingensis]